MMLGNLSPATQANYLRSVKSFTRFLGRSPDTATAEDFRLFQLHLARTKVSSCSINGTISGLRFFCRFTLDEPQLLRNMGTVFPSSGPPGLPAIAITAQSIEYRPRVPAVFSLGACSSSPATHSLASNSPSAVPATSTITAVAVVTALCIMKTDTIFTPVVASINQLEFLLVKRVKRMGHTICLWQIVPIGCS